MSSIYEPAEDSYLMSETLKKYIPKLLKENQELKFLEIGSGSGINLQTAKKLGIKINNISCCDINEEAVKHCRNLGFNCVESDLFENVKGMFDIIIFNPPYLPLDKKEPRNSRLNTTGGKSGNEIIVKFLRQAEKHLNKNGKIFLLTSSLTAEIDFNKLDYKTKAVSSKNLFFEKLFIWECLKI